MESEWRLTGREGGHKSQAKRMSQDLKDKSRRVKAIIGKSKGRKKWKLKTRVKTKVSESEGWNGKGI